MSSPPKQLSMFRQKRRKRTVDDIRIWAVQREEPDVDLVVQALINIIEAKAGITADGGVHRAGGAGQAQGEADRAPGVK